MRYEWDPEKAAANLRKHWVSFVDAIEALRDPNRIEALDGRFAYGEERAQVIGMAQRRILLVVITFRDPDTQRIISARRATRHEQDQYYQRDDQPW